jgi:hypothetical protein
MLTAQTTSTKKSKMTNEISTFSYVSQSGIAPHSIYQQQPTFTALSNLNQLSHDKNKSNTTKESSSSSGQTKELITSGIYGAVYSGVPVYEMMCRNVVSFCYFFLFKISPKK